MRTILETCDNRLVSVLKDVVLAPMSMPSPGNSADRKVALARLADNYGVDMRRAKESLATYFAKIGRSPDFANPDC